MTRRFGWPKSSFGRSANPWEALCNGVWSFKDVLIQSLRQVNELQQDTSRSVEALGTGRRDDVESVLMATQPADVAVKMPRGVRNKVIDAFKEIKQMGV